MTDSNYSSLRSETYDGFLIYLVIIFLFFVNVTLENVRVGTPPSREENVYRGT